MAGIVAMAAVIEDFEATQPCKKLRKDDDPPPTRTITNYFMPLAKTVEKPFSPPRSNNIMDYFRKTSPAQEKSSSQMNTHQQATEPLSHQEVSGKQSLPKEKRPKRSRKAKEQNKLQKEEQEVFTDNCEALENQSESSVKGGGGILGSETAALVICLEEESLKSSNPTETCASDEEVKDEVKHDHKSKNAILCRETDHLDNDDASAGEDKGRNRKSVVRKGKKAKASEPCNHEQSLHNASLEVNMDEASILNRSTVTVSFEEFLQSQSQENVEDTAAPEPDACNLETLSEPKSCNDLGLQVPQVSPRTLTVQAEVHPISPDHDATTGPKLKMASIFNRNKKESNKTPSSSNQQVTADILPDHKRKSNVVLLEEDLELAVVESSSAQKCTQEERKQFMNAFKQPSVDGSKGKPSKGPGKPKQAQDKVPEMVEEDPEEKPDENKSDMAGSEPSTEPKSTKTGGKKTRGKKPVKNRETDKAEEIQMTSPNEEELPTSTEVDKSVPVDDGNKQTVKEVRRSTREQTRRQTASTSERNQSPCTSKEEDKSVPDDETNKQAVKEVRRSTREQTRRQTESLPERNQSPRTTRGREKAEKSKPKAVPPDDPAQASTPKSHKSKKSVYRAEMICSPDNKGSPIRMKFTKVFPSSATKVGEFVISSPLSTLESNSLKKRKQAKKLIQKAKAIQQSKQMAAAEPAPMRRSSRTKESVKMNYCEDEDSVVFLEECNTAPTSQESAKTKKALRSLNDVLGKNTPSNRAPKNAAASGTKLAPMFLERKAQKPLTVISIFDDSSRDGSENSQDDEKFRAKREFLKSGLPESFKKQIAKTAANREAYTQACASYQAVIHVQQKPTDCTMWTLPWPESPFLKSLKEFYPSASVPSVSLEAATGHTTVPVHRASREKVSGWQEEFTDSVRQFLLEEISVSNPSFPAQRFFTRFLKRQKDYLLQTAVAEPECVSKTPCPAGPTKSLGGKRKRVDEGEKAGKLAKKQKSCHMKEEPIVIEDSEGTPASELDSAATSRGRTRRSARRKQTEQEPNSKVTSAPQTTQCDAIIIIDSPSPGPSCTGEGVKEDVLWTEKYQPQHSNDIIGNTASIRKLHSWLKEWKLRADREERRKQQEKKQEEDSNDSWLGGESSEDLEDMLCNTLLITGPTGVGKTAAVYACAQELGFKVFEVNCSSQRSGRQILSQLKEATQSHQVDIQGVNAHKPSFFNSYSSSSAGKAGPSPRKVNSPRRVVPSPRKPPQSPRGAKRKGGLAPTSLASLFKMSGKSKGKDGGNHACPKKSASVEPLAPTSDTKPTSEEQAKRTATSLILFEEVDVIFDDDSGFLAAIKTFMTTTKRPVILTTSDPTFSAMFDGYFDEIHFTAPSVVNVASFLQLLCLAENIRTETQDLACLLRWNRCDVRRSLLHLQFWARSGGGCQSPLPILPSTSDCKLKKKSSTVGNADGTLPPDSLPPCHTGCTESLLGLLNIQQEKAIVDLLKSEPSAEEKMRCWGLLSEAESRGVNLFYSNMELLLPLPVCPLPEPTLMTQPAFNPEPQPEILATQEEEPSEDMSPVKVSSRMRRKKQMCLDNKNTLQSDSESEDGFLSLPKSSCDPAVKLETKPAQNQASVPSVKRRVKLSDGERKRSKPVSQCLSSLADHLDDMSFLDSSLYYQPPQTEGACRPHSFTWTGAEVKSGMTDEVRLECGDRVSRFDPVEIQAVMGSLSFWKCKAGISGGWNAAQELEEEFRIEAVEELTLPVSSHRQSFSLTHSTPCEPRVMETRREVMTTVLASRSLSTLGHRTAGALDYLPHLRAICRSEKLREQGKVKRRFTHYFDTIHLDLPKSTIQQLASDFP